VVQTTTLKSNAATRVITYVPMDLGSSVIYADCVVKPEEQVSKHPSRIQPSADVFGVKLYIPCSMLVVDGIFSPYTAFGINCVTMGRSMSAQTGSMEHANITYQ
jgi:hypothetical protein